MRRQNKSAQPADLGRRATAAALAVLMGAGCVRLAPLHTQAQAAEANRYEIYPNPHVMTYSGGNYMVKNEVNVVVEKGIDTYTVDRLEEVLKLKNLTYTTSNEVVDGKTNILVGIEGSGEYVDTYSDKITVTTDKLYEKVDSYVLDNQGGVITVVGKDTDAAFYGLTTLYHVFSQMDSYTIQEFHVEDWADVASRGFIEGYYGNPWSVEDRANLMTWGGYYKLNAYFYAPKDDPKHRAQWSELYTQDELNRLIKPLAEAGNASKCRYVYALHPFPGGNHFRFDTEGHYQEDLKKLQAKFMQVIDCGVRQIAILADDFWAPGGDNGLRLLKDMTQWLETVVREKYPDMKTTMPYVPYDYMGNGSSGELQVLKKARENIQLVMTGGKVWGEVTNNFTTTFTKNVGRGPFMWINWPCTDNSKKHLIMGGYTTFLHPGVNPDNIQGIMLNPMQQSEPSKVAIFGNACYSWNIWKDEAEANQAWYDSFKYVDHNSAMETAASTALRELSKHMINQAMDARVTVLQESVELKEILNPFKTKLASSTVKSADVDKVMAKFQLLQEAAKTYRNQAGNTDVKDQIVHWLDCWDDTTEAAIAYLNGVKAVLDGDTNAVLRYNGQGKAAFDRSMTHEFWYVDHNERAEVGVQHIVPFIKTLAEYVSKYAELAMDPNKVIATFITNRTDNAVNGTDKALDGNDSTFVSYQAVRNNDPKGPTSYKDDYVGVIYNKVIKMDNIRFLLGNGKNHFDHAKLQYTLNGKDWVDLTLEGGKANAFAGVENQYQDIKLTAKDLPDGFEAMGIRLIATANNAKDSYLNVHEIQINQEVSVAAQKIEGKYTTSAGLTVQNGAGGLDNLKDGNSGTETWLSNAGNKTDVGAYIQLTFNEATQIGVVHFAQGSSNAGDVITNGKFQYQDEQGEWKNAGDVTKAKEQTFDFNGKGIVTKAVRIYNETAVPVWWRVGEFTVTVGTGSSDKPIEYNVIRSDRWKVVGGSEANLYDGKDNTFVYYDPDGGKEGNAPPKDTFAANEYLGYDLGKVAELDTIHLVVGNSAKAGDKIVKYTIETSLTGKNGTWTPVPKYESYTGKTNAVDTLDIKLSEPITARFIRVRNLEQRNTWGYFSEFTVTEVKTGSTEHLYTNLDDTGIFSNVEEGQVSLTSGTVTLNQDQYIGVDLGNIKAVTGVTTSELPANVTLQTSRNGITWTAYNAKSDLDARYVCAVSSADGVKLDLAQFAVFYKYVGKKSVESNFANGNVGRDMRTKGNVNAIFDGNLGTYAELTSDQIKDNYVTFDLGQTIHFNSLRYYIVETQHDYPGHVKFEVSVDGKTDWKQVMVVGSENPKDVGNVAKDATYFTHDSKNPGNMFAEITGLDVDGRYIRVTVLTTYTQRWLAFNEIQINGGAYISPEANRDIVSDVVEEQGKLPSYALDGNYATTYKPSKANGSFTYRVSAPQGLTSLRMVQLGAISNAVVTANFVGEDEAVTLGKLNQAISEFILPQGKNLESVTVTWKDTIPEIAEIATSTAAVKKADKANLKAELDKTQPTDTWTTDSVKAYQEAKKVAQEIHENETATQTVVDSALGALKSAADNAVLKATNIVELQMLVKEMVRNDSHIYTTISYYNYSSAVENLKTALEHADNLSQTKADQLKTAVENAQKALEYSTYNREVAQMTVESYASLVSENYSKATFDALTAAKKAIEALLNSQDAVTPMQFMQAMADYQAAVDALADITGLKAEIAKADEVNSKLYTAASYKAYADAVAAGKALLETGTKEQVGAAVADIQAKFAALTLKPDVSLDDVINQAEALNGESYTTDSYRALMALVAEAKANPADETYIQKIQDAMKTLVNVEALKAQLAAAQAVEAEKYTTSSYQVLSNRMGQGNALLQSGTQQKVDQMTAELDMAIRSLVARATGVEEYRNGITLLPADGYTAESYKSYKDAYDALMAAHPADLSASQFAQLKDNLEKAKLNLKHVEADKPQDNSSVQTGDVFNLVPYMLAVAVCAAGLGALVMVKSKKRG